MPTLEDMKMSDLYNTSFYTGNMASLYWNSHIVFILISGPQWLTGMADWEKLPFKTLLHYDHERMATGKANDKSCEYDNILVEFKSYIHMNICSI